DLAVEGVVSEQFDVLGKAVRVETLDGLHDPHVESAPPLLKEALVRHLMREGMLERVRESGEETSLVEEFARLEMRQAAAYRVLWHLRNRPEQSERHLRADDGGGLEQRRFLGRKLVDASGQDGMDGG